MIFKKIMQFFKSFFVTKHKKAKKSSGLMRGNIKFFDKKKRFGFIISGSKEYFFHAQGTNPKDFKALQDGAAVRFIIVQGKKRIASR